MELGTSRVASNKQRYLAPHTKEIVNIRLIQTKSELQRQVQFVTRGALVTAGIAAMSFLGLVTWKLLKSQGYVTSTPAESRLHAREWPVVGQSARSTF
jgi:hypothetical protein